MTSGEYLFNLLVNIAYTSAWWSLIVYPDSVVSEFVSALRLVFIGLTTILILWFIIEKLIMEGRKHENP